MSAVLSIGRCGCGCGERFPDLEPFEVDEVVVFLWLPLEVIRCDVLHHIPLLTPPFFCSFSFFSFSDSGCDFEEEMFVIGFGTLLIVDKKLLCIQ